mmetsp:Transcript_87172/g.281561  ORF Transcript_87172/g.281561 Transcript_87172/m.281561 type:complete len:84 (+) Transcript_87172:739-990(+)
MGISSAPARDEDPEAPPPPMPPPPTPETPERVGETLRSAANARAAAEQLEGSGAVEWREGSCPTTEDEEDEPPRCGMTMRIGL